MVDYSLTFMTLLYQWIYLEGGSQLFEGLVDGFPLVACITPSSTMNVSSRGETSNLVLV